MLAVEQEQPLLVVHSLQVPGLQNVPIYIFSAAQIPGLIFMALCVFNEKSIFGYLGLLIYALVVILIGSLAYHRGQGIEQGTEYRFYRDHLAVDHDGLRRIRYRYIRKVKLYRGLLERRYGLGTIFLIVPGSQGIQYTSEGNTKTIRLETIPQPEEVCRRINEIIKCGNEVATTDTACPQCDTPAVQVSVPAPRPVQHREGTVLPPQRLVGTTDVPRGGDPRDT